MSRGQRYVVFGGGLVVLLILAIPTLLRLPAFGRSTHPLRDLAVQGAVAHETANAVSSVNFDQRSFDTLGEELIFLASVSGVAALLRRKPEEKVKQVSAGGYVMPPIKLLTYLMLPLTLVVGADVVVHGHVTPGGGFQGGIVLATGLHLLYVGGTYETLERLRPLEAFEILEAAGQSAFIVTGVAALFSAAAFLANFLPFGSFGSLLSAGTVPLLSVAVGIAVAGGVVVLLADFLRQALSIRRTG